MERRPGQMEPFGAIARPDNHRQTAFESRLYPTFSPVVYGRDSIYGVVPSRQHAEDIAEGLKNAWRYEDADGTTSRVAYAHASRLEPEAWLPGGEIGEKLATGEMKIVGLTDSSDRIVASALIIFDHEHGNAEIGSVQANPELTGSGRRLIREVYGELKDTPSAFFDSALARTAMSRTARSAAMPKTGEEFDPRDARIVFPSYVIGNVFGDKKNGITWGSVGDATLSASYLEANGPLSAPILPEGIVVDDGVEEMLSLITGYANIEGMKHEVPVFGERREVKSDEEFSPHKEVAPGVFLVDFRDYETRRMFAGFGHSSIGFSFGIKDQTLNLGVYYSRFAPREVEFRRSDRLTQQEHPSITDVKETAHLINHTRARMLG